MLQRGRFQTDKKGRPIIIERMGHSKIRELLDIVDIEELIDFIIYQNEANFYIMFPLCSLRVGKRIDRIVFIADMKDLQFSKVFDTVFLKAIKKFVQIAQDYYPQFLNKVIIVNAPVMFLGVWNVIKLWINERTR